MGSGHGTDREATNPGENVGCKNGLYLLAVIGRPVVPVLGNPFPGNGLKRVGRLGGCDEAGGLPVPGWVDALLDQPARGIAKLPGLLEADGRVVADRVQILSPSNPVAEAPELGASRRDQQEQRPAIRQLVCLGLGLRVSYPGVCESGGHCTPKAGIRTPDYTRISIGCKWPRRDSPGHHTA